ncbi:helix-turn-helix domain-containing protein [Halanaerobium sp. Z-7514]|uniref:Helix-turn-helix domain-containing protein n=1 Tax=Halanaerobium polyolivorans TaxID=2886943 RepID=A0AAW4WZ79_9FIRM|nr:helix-turn-helix domain-containing protein [Halanaerobium polyolivorans]MCC3144174.1 helix-turn-helix domain-containing protein [Halanaerobium polyolivorans]
MICENINFEFGVPVKISLNSISGKKHFNRSFKLIWVLKGTITFESHNFYSDTEEVSNLSEEGIEIINSFSPFKLINQSEDAKFLVFEFKNKYLKDFELEFEDKIFHINDSKNLGKLRYLAALLAKNYFKEDYQLYGKIKASLDELLTLVNKKYCIYNQRQDDFFNKKQDDIVIKVMKRIEEDYNLNLTLNSIADEFHYNSSYLSEKFKSLLQINFTDYLDKLRLEKSLQELLYTNKNINQIALESGFSNIKSFYRVFNKHFDFSPVKVKKNYPRLKKDFLIEEFGEIDFFIIYFNHIIRSYEKKESKRKEKLQKNVKIDLEQKHQTINLIWQKLINAGTAQSIMDSNLRKQIRDLQQQISFEYLRFEGIFNDDLEIIKGNDTKSINYNWKLVDNIFDFILENDLKPFIVLSFMPKLMASKDKTIFYYQANFSPPENIDDWLNLIDAFIIHLINRYGIKKIKKWYFQVWTEFPHRGFHWAGTKREYFEFYAATAKKIKNISSEIQVGPASESFLEGKIISEEFLKYAADNDLPLDFYSINLYHNTIPLIEEELDLKDFYKESTLENIKFKFKEKNYSIKMAEKIKAILNNYYPKSELITTRWNVSWNPKEYIHDTAFMTNYIVDNALKLQDKLDGLGYLNLSDLISEWPINELPFFGGRGLINTEGIKKSAYYAYLILSKLGSKIIEQGDNYIVTAEGEDIQIIVYNYAYLSKSYQNADYSLIDEFERYQVFQKKDPLEFDLKLFNLSGKYKQSRYFLNRDSGSAFDEWLKMGAPHELSRHEIKYLKYKSFPDLKVKYLNLKGELEINTVLEAHSLEFIILRKQFSV